MQQVEVDSVGTEAPQTAFDSLDRALARGVRGQHLRDNEHLVATSLDCLADDLLGAAVGASRAAVESLGGRR